MIALCVSLASVAAGYAFGLDWLYWASLCAIAFQWTTNKRGGYHPAPIAKKTHKP